MSRPHKTYGNEYNRNKFEDFEKRKNDMFNDLVELCTEHILSTQNTYEIVKNIAWSWTDGMGNGYQGCTYWSEAALKKCYNVEDVSECKEKTSHSNKDLRHEHIVPKRLFIEYIMDKCYKNKENPNRNFIDGNLIGCIITADEDKLFSGKLRYGMSNEICFEDINCANRWLRYLEAGISKIYNVSWKLTDDGKKLIIDSLVKITNT